MDTTRDIPHTVNRTTAAAIIGIKPDTLKRWAMQRRGPQPAAKLGPEQQSRVLYDPAEIERWRCNPAGYRWSSSPARGRTTNTTRRHDNPHRRRGR